MELLPLLLGCAAIFFVLRALLRAVRRHPAPPRPPPPTRSTKSRLKGSGSFNLHVAGTEHYKPALLSLYRKLIAEATDDGADDIDESDAEEVDAVATLVLESSNPHDANAVAVHLRGKLVGYVPRGSAGAFRDHVKRQGLDGTEFTCAAQVEVPLHPQGDFRIALDLPQLKA